VGRPVQVVKNLIQLSGGIKVVVLDHLITLDHQLTSDHQLTPAPHPPDSPSLLAAYLSPPSPSTCALHQHTLPSAIGRNRYTSTEFVSAVSHERNSSPSKPNGVCALWDGRWSAALGISKWKWPHLRTRQVTSICLDAHSFFYDSHYGTTNPRLREVSGKHAQLVFSILYITSADFSQT
jgi:hypothetical protein